MSQNQTLSNTAIRIPDQLALQHDCASSQLTYQFDDLPKPRESEATQGKAAPTDWDYRLADIKELTHGIHPYPAMMIPQIARRLIDSYGEVGELLFDPYCGSGTTLLEGALAGMRAVGTDLNPLARLISSAKTTPVEPKLIDEQLERFAAFVPAKFVKPKIPNVDYWFSPETQRDLAAIRSFIDEIDSNEIANAFRVAFSLAVRKTSWTRNSEFKLHRLPEFKMKKDNDVFGEMKRALLNVREALDSILAFEFRSRPVIHEFNSVELVPAKAIAPQSVDLVVTSPPYGDSHTTVAYGQFSRLSSQWLGYQDAGQIDRNLMGGLRAGEVSTFGCGKLDRVIQDIADLDFKRACEVSAFFVDYLSSISNVARTLRPGGTACYVVGNRTVKGQEVPTSEATADFFERDGCDLIEMKTRNIPNKRMPSVNSPSNVPGKTGKTMTTEHIVVCRKVRQ